jgi:hypothetical protein
MMYGILASGISLDKVDDLHPNPLSSWVEADEITPSIYVSLYIPY